MARTRRELLGAYDDAVQKFEGARRRAHEMRTGGDKAGAKKLLDDARRATSRTRDELRAAARTASREW